MLKALDAFLTSDGKCFLLKGYAGTGKTTITKHIADYLHEQKIQPVLLAPTGRASRILSIKTKHKAITIHKGIYNLEEVDEVEVGKDERKKYKFRYLLRRTEASVRRVFLIDEASMISDKYSEDDFFVFGSGRLLKDLVSFIGPENKDRDDRIIFIGDPAQLPPVTDAISGALSAAYLLEHHRIAASEYELTQVVRQAEGSGILANATYLREQLTVPRRNSFELKTSFSDVHGLEANEVVDAFLKMAPSPDAGNAIIINYSNKAALDFNQRIRERLFADKMQIEPGDVLMIAQNNYSSPVELLNGMMVRVREVSPVPEVKSGMLSYDANNKEIRVSHKFRRVVLEVPDEDGRLVAVICLILENFLYSPDPSLDYAENIALYLDFKMRHPHLRLKRREFSDALRSDPYFNALRVKYGYAITCHKAQGGEWKNAIVNLDVSQGKLSENFLRWTYTAITRASDALYLFNVPRQNQFSQLQYHRHLTGREQAATPAGSVNEIEFEKPEDFDVRMSQMGLAAAAQFQQEKFLEVLAASAAEGIEVLARKGNQYQERYVFTKDGKHGAINFAYDGRNRFTTINIAANETTAPDFATFLKELFSRQATSG